MLARKMLHGQSSLFLFFIIIPVTNTVVVIGSSINEQNLLEQMKRFAPVNIVTMPPFGSIPHTNKFSAFLAVKVLDYDVLILLGCDTK